MLYKSLIRSIIDYGIYIYIPKDLNLALKLERGQFLGLRTALGYRNSTPNNVILAEAKIVLLRERARMLAKNLCSKIYKYGEENIRISLERLRTGENYERFRNPIYRKSILCEAWEQVTGMSKFFSPLKTDSKYGI